MTRHILALAGSNAQHSSLLEFMQLVATRVGYTRELRQSDSLTQKIRKYITLLTDDGRIRLVPNGKGRTRRVVLAPTEGGGNVLVQSHLLPEPQEAFLSPKTGSLPLGHGSVDNAVLETLEYTQDTLRVLTEVVGRLVHERNQNRERASRSLASAQSTRDTAAQLLRLMGDSEPGRRR